MTAVVDRPAGPARATLRTLAWVETRRYARHPLFLLGTALFLWTAWAVHDDVDATSVDGTIIPAFFLGVLGVLVGYQLTRSMSRSKDAVEAVPADGVVRTAALCIACLLPGSLALVWAVWLYVDVGTQAPDSAVGASTRAAMVLAGVVYAVGGPLFGVLVGRWTRFPGAGLGGAVLLIAWVLLGTFGLMMSPSRLGTLVHLSAPATNWTSSDAAGQPAWIAGGSPWWYLGYITLLCGLAATAASVHEAVGNRRARLWRVLAILGVLAVGCLALAVAPDPSRIPL